MAEIEILLPKMGESVAEATIIKWLKEEGDTVEMDEPIVEIATDKVDSEVPAPEDGILVKKLCGENDVIQVGQAIATFATEGSAVIETGNGSAEKAAVPPPPAPSAPASIPSVTGAIAISGSIVKNGPSGKFYSPLVRNIATAEGITMAQLEVLSGSGRDGRVTKNDILAFVKNGSSAQKASAQAPAAEIKPAKAEAPPVQVSGEDEIIEMDRMRKLIAEHMVMSKRTSPHVTSYVEADVTNLVMWRNRIKDSFLEREGEKMTFTPIFIEALVRAIKEMPMINIQLDGHNIIKKKNINIGMAAALPSGNLIVPVIHNADMYNLTGLAKKVNDLANRARNNKLAPDDIQGGTYTITNVGTFGNVMGTPIINQPQVAIMAVGAIRKKPAVVETPSGDTIGIRHKMFLSHSYDHRVVDGALGGKFVRRVADFLEQWDPEREL